MLTKVELEEFQNKLLDRRVQIEKNLTGTALELEGMRDLELNDEGDHAATSAKTIVDSAILVQQRKELNEIELALDKIKGKPRLEVKNFAHFCITCREIKEKEQK